MKDDRIITGIIAGTSGSLGQSLLTYLLVVLEISKIHYLLLAGDIFLYHDAVQTAYGLAVGFFADITIGSIWGIILAFIYPMMKMENAWFLKSIGFGLITWLIGIGFLERMFHVFPLLEKSPKSSLSLLAGSITFGLITSWMIKRITRKKPRL
ncbi:MAG: hypothetical protein K6U80_06870 [Firmicutes bacterium]|nr:hypothetical protein [Bacillota bacterium]